MAESEVHRALVRLMRDWVASTFVGSEYIQMPTDSHGATRTPRPPELFGYVPDLFVPKPDGTGAIVGEAKTARDLENSHTYAQLTAYLQWCSRQGHSVLVIAVPWYASRTANSMVTNIMRRHRLRTDAIVLDQLNPDVSR